MVRMVQDGAGVVGNRKGEVMPGLLNLPIIDASVSCDNCGACCSEMRTPPHMVCLRDGQFEPREGWAEDFAILMAAPEEARLVRLEGLMSDRPVCSPCSWLDPKTKQCRWYEFRPEICRDFDRGCKPCLDWREKLGVPTE